MDHCATIRIGFCFENAFDAKPSNAATILQTSKQTRTHTDKTRRIIVLESEGGRECRGGKESKKNDEGREGRNPSGLVVLCYFDMPTYIHTYTKCQRLFCHYSTTYSTNTT